MKGSLLTFTVHLSLTLIVWISQRVEELGQFLLIASGETVNLTLQYENSLMFSFGLCCYIRTHPNLLLSLSSVQPELRLCSLTLRSFPYCPSYAVAFSLLCMSVRTRENSSSPNDVSNFYTLLHHFSVHIHLLQAVMKRGRFYAFSILTPCGGLLSVQT